MLQERDSQADIVQVEKMDKKGEKGVVFDSVSGKWNSDETEMTLDNVTVSATTGKLVAIIGSVGAGKSSIIQAILGEFPTSKGKISINGKISYSSQEAWVFSGSVKDNILFGAEFDKNRYWKVIEACALSHDLTQWEFGDRTLVGERGVSLSGGQKARVNLARAIYREADTYLLDDPLSAVDVHVGRHLFNNCIRGYLKNKSVILVTHQLQYLQDADEIIVMKKGRVEDKGTFKNLIQNGMDFSAFLAEEEKEEKENEEEEVKKKNIRNRTLSLCSDAHSLLSEMSQSKMHSNIATETLIEEECIKSKDEKSMKDDPKQVKEQRSTGSVKASVYTKYFTSGGGWISVIFMIAVNLLCQGLYSGSDIWLSYWTNKEEMKIIERNSSFQEVFHALPAPSIYESDNYTVITDLQGENELQEHYFNLGIYAAIVLALIVTSMIRTIHFFYLCMRSSVKLHDSMFNRLLRAPCRFFDTNPVGKNYHIVLLCFMLIHFAFRENFKSIFEGYGLNG